MNQEATRKDWNERGFSFGILRDPPGQVSPKNDANLYKDFKSSSGVGLRIVFSSVVLRADIATGEEGSERTVFVGYGF